MRRSKTAIYVLAGIPLIFFVAFFIAPMCVVGLSSLMDGRGNFSFASYERILFDRYHWSILFVTFRLALLTTVFCVIFGYPLAYFIVRIIENRLLQRIFVILVILPLFTSNIVRSFGWIILLGRRGLINDVLISMGLVQFPVKFIGAEAGILIGLVYINLPFIVLTVGNAILKLDDSLENAARDLGAGGLTTFRTITFPLCLPSLFAGAVMVFALSVSAYVTPALLGGGRVTMFSMLIFQQYSAVFDFHYGGALSATLLVLTLIMVTVASRFGTARGAA